MPAAEKTPPATSSDALQAAKHAVRALDGDELRAFAKWYRDYYDGEGWDKQIEMDSRSGRLDAERDEAILAHRSGESEPL